MTNLEVDNLSIDEALHLLRLRWQIELLFKLWKQHLSLDEWRSDNPCQILSEVYAKLIGALVQHWFCLLGCWQENTRSLIKACLTMQKHAFHIHSVLSDFKALLHALETILPALARCKVQKRKASPATFQLLGLASP